LFELLLALGLFGVGPKSDRAPIDDLDGRTKAKAHAKTQEAANLIEKVIK